MRSEVHFVHGHCSTEPIRPITTSKQGRSAGHASSGVISAKLDGKARARLTQSLRILRTTLLAARSGRSCLHPYQLAKDHRTKHSESNTARVFGDDIHLSSRIRFFIKSCPAVLPRHNRADQFAFYFILPGSLQRQSPTTSNWYSSSIVNDNSHR